MTLTSHLPACQPDHGKVDAVRHVRGDAASLSAALEGALPILKRFAERFCASASDADDLVQDIIERALRQGLPADIRSPLAWLVTMTHHLFIDRCRAAARTPHVDPLDDGESNVTALAVDSPEPAWTDVTLADVRAALDDINPTYREVYQLHTFEHRTYEEIAALLNLNRVTVGTRLTRARQRLRELLVARLGLEDEP